MTEGDFMLVGGMTTARPGPHSLQPNMVVMHPPALAARLQHSGMAILKSALCRPQDVR